MSDLSTEMQTTMLEERKRPKMRKKEQSLQRRSPAHHDTVIEPNDHVIVFVPNKRMVRQVEKLFQVSATFF